MVRALFVILAVAIAAVSTEVSSIISTVTMFYERCSGGVPFSRPDGNSSVVVKLRQLQYLYWNIHTRPAVFCDVSSILPHHGLLVHCLPVPLLP